MTALSQSVTPLTATANRNRDGVTLCFEGGSVALMTCATEPNQTSVTLTSKAAARLAKEIAALTAGMIKED